jgi:hypothetical protein
MIDECQYCGQYGHLLRQGAACLCGYCRRQPDAPGDGGGPADRPGSRHDRESCDAC